ncbi:MAG TPA: Flp family type IVb pilin [Xanthobacteraceae bacterium]|jgi:pilus assembly protein Flp/PilA
MKQTATSLLFDLKRLYENESGATAIEYALIAMCISITIVAAATAVGTSLNTVFDKVGDSLNAATGG